MSRSRIAEEIKTSLVKARLGTLLPAAAPSTAPAPSTIGFAKPGDRDPPYLDAKGMPTMRNVVDELLYCSPKVAECDEHTWEPHAYSDAFKQCAVCKRSRLRKGAKLATLLPLFKDRVFPPTNARGRYHETCIVNRKLYLKRSWVTWHADRTFIAPTRFTLYVKFGKGWLWSTQFTEYQFDRIIRAVDPLLADGVDYDPCAVYVAVQQCIYGKAFGAKHLNLERLA